MAIVALDIEVYPNYFLAMCKEIETGKTFYRDMSPGEVFDKEKVLAKVLSRNTLITFNGLNFDMPILRAAMRGATCTKLKQHADDIIVGDKRYWQLGLDQPEGDHIDLMEVAPGRSSLKLYGGRLHARTLRDLPYPPDANLSDEQKRTVREYCANDLDLTIQLYKTLLPQITLREHMGEKYGIDLRSKSDAQIAEHVIFDQVKRRSAKHIERKQTVTPGRTFHYAVPDFIRPAPEVDFVKSCVFTINDKGAPECKPLDNHKVQIGNSVYRMGIGGLHSCEKKQVVKADPSTLLLDRDVASYYPSIIRECRLYPEHMGQTFLGVYGRILDERLRAKARVKEILKEIDCIEKELADEI